jgi:hypothetical protein
LDEESIKEDSIALGPAKAPKLNKRLLCPVVGEGLTASLETLNSTV